MKEIILLATSNLGKAREFEAFFAPQGLQLLAASQLIKDFSLPEETGTTFAQNAGIKAEYVASRLSNYVIADDSGLCVDYLHGNPGIRSARYAGANASDQENNARLLAELQEVQDDGRRAKFVCAIALAKKGLPTMYFHGECDGVIAREPSGDGGFGYDSLFIEMSTGKSFAVLDIKEKNRLSHRGIALAKAIAHLKESF